MKFYLGMLLIVAGAVLGVSIDRTASQPTVAVAASNAQARTGGHMTVDTMMQANSPADREMNEAMMRMMKTMNATKMTGEPDRDFMVMMIPHHQAAIDMAKVEIRHGKQARTLVLARNIIVAQMREIAEMKTWLAAVY